MMTAMDFGFECLTANDSQLITAQCFCFVDDKDVIKAGKSVEQSGEDICHSVQQAASTWAGGISATGGAINPEKSFWWLIDFVWDSREGKWRFRRMHQLLPDHNLQIPGLTGTLEALRRLEPDEAEKTLGVMLAPLEDQQAHVAHLKSITKKRDEQVQSGHLQKCNVIPLIKTKVMKSLEYPMVLTTLDAATWVSIMSPVLQVCLPKAGIFRSFPRDMVLAPLKFQGLGIPCPFGTQVSKHIEVLIRHLSNRTKTGAYMEAAVQEHQLETGTSFGLFQQDYSNMAILASDTWLKRVWKELEDLDIYVALDSPLIPLRCEGDALLIGVFMELEVDQDALKWLNWCRTTGGRGRSTLPEHYLSLTDPSAYCVILWAHGLILSTTGTGYESLLAEALLKDRLCVISDGSYKLGLGMAAVQLPPRKGGKEHIIVQSQTPGLPDDQSAYRSELIGLLAGIMVVDWLMDQWAPTLQSPPHVRIACNGFLALLNTFSDNQVTTQQAQFDLVSSIRETLARSRALWEPSHVYGHLDKATSFSCLSWWSKRNVEVDAWASRLNPEQVQELVALPALRKRWHERQTITSEAELGTDWTSLACAMSSLPAGVQWWTTKHVVGMCGVGKFKVRWGSADSAACLFCGKFKDHFHVPRCMVPLACAEWERRTAMLDQWLDTQVTDPAIKHAILHLLQGVCDPSLPCSRLVLVCLHRAFLSQQCIGYQGLLEGRLSVQWAALQEQYLQSQGSQRSPTLWVSCLSHQLILLGFHMWEHRNSVQHLEDNVHLRERSRLVNDGIHSQFDMGPTDLPKVVQRMLAVKRRTVLNKPLVYREEWLKLVRMECTTSTPYPSPLLPPGPGPFTRFEESTPQNHPTPSPVELGSSRS
ncbi:unnamed protein product [Cylindrotheca closterium]|uniref:Uncharacterized protein n=1 Tax=Cylindrotheca closterium TaxID=2856 RepID=A0AAD2JLC9_9STRA|nr:unnamed protein product [Cylindrotheca closterium]